MAERRENGAGTKPKYDPVRKRWVQKISYTDTNGTRGRKTIYGSKESECKQKTEAFRKTIEAGLNIDAEKITVEQWLLQWLKTYKKIQLEVTSYANYEFQAKEHIIPVLGNIKLKKLQRVHIQDFFNQKKDSLSAGTLALIKAVLVNALKAAVVDKYILQSPAVGIKLPTIKNRTVKPFTKEEVRSLLAAIENQVLYSMVFVAAHTGARKGELAALVWDDIDFKSKVIHIRNGVKLDRANKKYIIGSTKTPKAVRDIPVSEVVIEELKRHKARQAKEILALGIDYAKNNLVFADVTGEIYSLGKVNHWFCKAIKAAGINRGTFHDLRHTFASICISRKENIKALSEYMGHSNIGITYDTYGHLIPGDKEGISAAITEHFAGI